MGTSNCTDHWAWIRDSGDSSARAQSNASGRSSSWRSHVSIGFAAGGCGRSLSPTAPAPVTSASRRRTSRAVQRDAEGTRHRSRADDVDGRLGLDGDAERWDGVVELGEDLRRPGTRRLRDCRAASRRATRAVVSANGYQSVTRTITISADSATDFPMLPDSRSG